MTTRDWNEWHKGYNNANSDLSKRLHIVQGFIRQALPTQLTKPLRILDLCAGDGRDLLDVLESYNHTDMIQARMIELDPTLAAAADSRVKASKLEDSVIVVEGDAADTSLFADSIPANLVMLCGIFGNISEADIANTIHALPTLCAEGANIIWTRNRREPDLTPTIRNLFTEAGLVELDFAAPEDVSLKIAVGLNHFNGTTQPLQANQTLFTFIR